MIISCLVIIHIIGAIITICIHCRDGTMESAAKYGDGVRFAKPSDVIILDCLAWEILLIIHIVDYIENHINNQFGKHLQ